MKFEYQLCAFQVNIATEHSENYPFGFKINEQKSVLSFLWSYVLFLFFFCNIKPW